jgi:hypothetical protein
MKKHVISCSESYQNNIGRGSVILIKGKPEPDGRKLYATTITGYTEIKPGIKMVFLGDQMYRVIWKNGQFFGRKIDIRGEEGLMGVLNLKRPGTPSIVLNHNKTPFHWMTLKNLDIGTALREIGSRLFSHDLILESVESESIFREVAKCLLKDPSSMLKIQSIEFDGGSAFDEPNEYVDGTSYSETEWGALMSFSLSDRATSQFTSKLQDYGIITGIIDDVLSDFLDVDDSINVDIYFTSELEWYQSYDRGDYWTPPSSEIELEEVSTYIESIMIDEDEYIVDGDVSNLNPHLEDLYKKLSSIMQEAEPSDLDKLASSKT